MEPYSYSDLRKFLSAICVERNNNIIKYCIAGKTLSGNSIYSLLITDFNSSFKEIGLRKSIIFTSRIHPGEANSSFIIESIINFLIGNSNEANILRKYYIFKIIPMLNPDGVICGNYRCSLNGIDLNRQWIDPKEIFSQEVFAVKDLIKRTSESREIELFCDFHGHFRKQNVFLYGCETPSKYEQIFPYLLQKRSNVFSIKDCKNNIEKEKESTARVVVHREFNIIQSYTCESSMLGSNFGKYADYHFSKSIYKEFGIHFCQAILDLTQNALNSNFSWTKDLYIPYSDSREMNQNTNSNSNNNNNNNCTNKSKNLLKKSSYARNEECARMVQNNYLNKAIVYV